MKDVLMSLLVLFSLLLPGVAGAETIALKRGLSTDIWLTWPDGDELGSAKLINVFPEYRQSFTGGEFQLAKAAGFDFIRLTVDPAIFLWKPSAAKTGKLLAGVNTAISEIRAAGLKVVVDLHSIPRGGSSPGTDQVLANDAAFAAYLQVVRDVGQAIASQPPDEVAFEPMNEPTIDCYWDKPAGYVGRWPVMLARLHQAARKAAPDLTIVLSGACWGGAEGLVRLNPATIKDSNVIWSFHSYEPFLFSHQGASWSDDPVQFAESLSFPPKPKDKAKILQEALSRLAASSESTVRKKAWADELRRKINDYHRKGRAAEIGREGFVKVERWRKKHRIPVSRIMLGEFGAIRGDLSKPLSDAARGPLYAFIRKEAEARGYSWSTWSWGGSFGLNRHEGTRDFSPVLMQALGLKGG